MTKENPELTEAVIDFLKNKNPVSGTSKITTQQKLTEILKVSNQKGQKTNVFTKIKNLIKKPLAHSGSKR